MKKALQCKSCSMIVHKKCMPQCSVITSCSEAPVDPNQSRLDESSFIQSDSSTLSPDRIGLRSRLASGLKQSAPAVKAAGLMQRIRQRKSRNNLISTSQTAAEGLTDYPDSSDAKPVIMDDTVAASGAAGGPGSRTSSDPSFDAEEFESLSSSDDETTLELNFMKDYYRANRGK